MVTAWLFISASSESPTRSHESRAKPVWATSIASTTDGTSQVLASRRSLAPWKSSACMVSSSAGDLRCHDVERDRDLLGGVTANDGDDTLGEVARARPRRAAAPL